MVTLQDLIHHMELGAGMRFLNRTVGLVLCSLGLLVLVAAYDLCAFRNMATQEAMDSAQLAHNLAQGKGFSTLFVRPLSIYLLQTRRQLSNDGAAGPTLSDPAQLKGNHPDLANPPVYPLLLAGLMKVLPFNYAISKTPGRFWGSAGKFYRYQPDFLIAIFNQIVLFGLVISSFFLARHLFDAQVAWLSAAVLLGTELLWRFSVSGLSTVLLLLIFTALVWCLVFLEREAREPKWNRAGIFILSALAGALVGLGGLTRYSFCWLILPVLLFVIAYTGRRSSVLGPTVLLAFLVVMAPWVNRNYSLSGMPFGTATLAVIENSSISSEDRLERSLSPELLKPVHNSFPFLTAAAHVFLRKLVVNGRGIVQSELPKLGGTWVSAFFLVGLLVRFRSPTLNRLRLFLLASILVLVVTQAVGRTKLSDDSPEINSENLLVLVEPLVVMYGVSLFFILLEQVELPFLQLRAGAIGLFGLVMGLPLVLAILPPKTIPVVYPPYYPPSIQNNVGWTREDELLMSDIPWAVAWYGQSQCIWLTLSARPDFFNVNDLLKPVTAVYLTVRTIDRWTQAGDWGNLFLHTIRVLPGDNAKYPLPINFTLTQRDNPTVNFPLKFLQAGWPSQLLFTYREHWPTSQ
jgi:hypothetical protein